MSQKLPLRVYDRSITVDEHRQLRLAADAACLTGEVTYLEFPGGRAAVVPEEAARWWELYVAGICTMCAQDNHVFCFRYESAPRPCTCIIYHTIGT